MRLINRGKAIPHTILLFIVLYFGISVYKTNHPHNSKWYTIIFTGIPYVEVTENKGTVNLLKEIDRLSILLDHPSNWTVQHKTELKTAKGRQWIELSGLKSISEMQLMLQNSDRGFTKFKIIKVVINGEDVAPHLAFKEFLKSDITTIEYPLSIHNLNTTLSYPLKAILPFLFILLLVTFIYQFSLTAAFCLPFPPIVKGLGEYTKNFQTTSIIDQFSRESAIFTGFLATIASLWLGISEISSDNTDIYFFIEKFKTALSTTVLGLSIKILTVVQQHLKKLFNA